MAGYTRQASANIGPGLPIQSADLNAEFDQLQVAFDGASGHSHTGGSGLGPKISLTTSVSGILPLANGGIGISSATAGSVIFSNGTTLATDSSSFFWDGTNNYLGVGTSVPIAQVHAHIPAAATSEVRVTNSVTGSTVADGTGLLLNSLGESALWNYENTKSYIATNNAIRITVNAGGNVSIGNSNNTYKLDVTGIINASTGYYVAGTALHAANLSDGTTGTGAIMLAASPTTTGTLTAQNYSGSGTLNVAGASNFLSTLAVVSDLSVGGDLGVFSDLGVVGDITAHNYVGSGTLNVTGASNFLSTLGIVSNASVGGNLGVTGNITAQNYVGSGTLNVAGASNFLSTLGIVSNASVGGDLAVTGNTVLTGNITANDAILDSLTLATELAIASGGTSATTALGAFNTIVRTAATLNSPGLIQFKNGLMLQWGSVAVVASTSQAVSFPSTFLVATFVILPSIQMTAGAGNTVGLASETTSGFTMTFGSSFSGTAYWFAVGV